MRLGWWSLVAAGSRVAGVVDAGEQSGAAATGGPSQPSLPVERHLRSRAASSEASRRAAGRRWCGTWLAAKSDRVSLRRGAHHLTASSLARCLALAALGIGLLLMLPA